MGFEFEETLLSSNERPFGWKLGVVYGNNPHTWYQIIDTKWKLKEEEKYADNHLNCMISEQRMIKSWLVVDMDTIDYITIRALF